MAAGKNRELQDAKIESTGRCLTCGGEVKTKGAYFCPGHDSHLYKAMLKNPETSPLMIAAIELHVISTNAGRFQY